MNDRDVGHMMQIGSGLKRDYRRNRKRILVLWLKLIASCRPRPSYFGRRLRYLFVLFFNEMLMKLNRLLRAVKPSIAEDSETHVWSVDDPALTHRSNTELIGYIPGVLGYAHLY